MTVPPIEFDPPIIGSSSSVAGLRELVLTLSASDVSVLITGESGVGKEVLARNLHRFCRRRDRPFVTVNCAALAPGILESELSGHSRGAFTGAVRSHAGLFEQADDGTLFLDEIGEIPPYIQAKLLRVLQEGEIRRMGEGAVRHVDVRVVSATNADLNRMVKDGTFREDLFYRINVIETEVRPLRERTGDIADLVAHFYRRRGSAPPDIDAGARTLMTRYSWPGNIRELENELERLIALHGAPARITSGMFSPRVMEAAGVTRLDVGVLYDAPLSRAVSYLEQNLLKKTLIQTNWNKTQTARQLGLSRQGLLQKIKRYGISRESLGDPVEDTGA